MLCQPTAKSTFLFIISLLISYIAIICTKNVFQMVSNSNQADYFNVWHKHRTVNNIGYLSNLSSGNGLVPDGSKPTPEPLLATSPTASIPSPVTDFHQLLKRAEGDPSFIAALNTIQPITVQWSTTIYKKKPLRVGRSPFRNCLVHNCRLIQMGKEHPQVDAYVFHVFHTEKVVMPKNRNPQQKFIFFAKESETRTFTVPVYMKGIFNVTMSHRLDSDIPVPYGAIKRKLPSDPRPKPGMNFAAKKTRLAAWVVSHCNTPSKREEYVIKMQQFMKVDVYGRCGPMKCPPAGCWGYINERYKFYLAFENSLCVDYVTEKLYRTLYHGKMIPVLLGGANYSALLPEKSFIDVADFNSPRELSRYLKLLDANDTLYNDYFQWRYRYKALISPFLDYCRMCAYLHLTKSVRKVYPNVEEWFSKGQCTNTSTYYGPSVDITRK